MRTPTLLPIVIIPLALAGVPDLASARPLRPREVAAPQDPRADVTNSARKRPWPTPAHMPNASTTSPSELGVPPDSPAPSQRLTTDRARPGIRIVFGLVLRAPFDPSYGLTLDYGASRFFELGTVVAMREDRGLEFGGSLGFRPLGRGFTSLILRATASAIVASGHSSAPTAGRIDAGAGYAMFGAGVYFEVFGGAAYRLGEPYARDRWAVVLAVRLGLGF